MPNSSRNSAFALVLIGLVALAGGGCATTQKIADDIMGEGGVLKKRVAFVAGPSADSIAEPIADPEDPAADGNELGEKAVLQLKARLDSGCGGVRLIDKEDLPQALKDPARLPTGEIEPSAVQEIGETMGLAALLEASVSPPECVTEKRGIWGFRDICNIAQASFRVRVYDVETTAVLLDETIRDGIELSEDDWDEVRTRGLNNPAITERLLASMIPRVAQKVCARLTEEPWKGHVAPAEDNHYQVAGGTDIGLSEGDVLEVFEPGTPIEGFEGRTYLIPGVKLGEIRIIKVQQQGSVGVAQGGADLAAGRFVRLKK